MNGSLSLQSKCFVVPPLPRSQPGVILWNGLASNHHQHQGVSTSRPQELITWFRFVQSLRSCQSWVCWKKHAIMWPLIFGVACFFIYGSSQTQSLLFFLISLLFRSCFSYHIKILQYRAEEREITCVMVDVTPTQHDSHHAKTKHKKNKTVQLGMLLNFTCLLWFSALQEFLLYV